MVGMHYWTWRRVLLRCRLTLRDGRRRWLRARINTISVELDYRRWQLRELEYRQQADRDSCVLRVSGRR